MTDAILSEELYFKYLNTYERESRFRIDSFRFDGEPQWTTKFGQARIRPSQVRVLLCRCGANNWKDDGRFANEYSCDSCGQFVEVLQHNDR
ncbi:hypothetical protein AAIE55_004086 [Salmonella enterica]